MRTLLLLAVLALHGGGSTDVIDRRIAERWESEGLRPAPLADDYEYFRRLSLDLRGVIPTPDEIRKFAADPDAAKREKTVEGWLRSEAFATWWSRRWADDLTLYPTGKVQVVHGVFRDWLRDAVRSNMPYDRFVRRMLTAKGPSDLDPAVGFLAAGLFNAKEEGSKDVVERTARVFLGMQIRCAECHDHPFDDWTQQDFSGMAAFFWQARSEVRGGGGTEPQSGWIIDDPGRGEPGIAGAEKAAKKPEEPKNGKQPGPSKQSVGPRYKATGEGVGENESRRAAFARILTADRQFARAAVNRHWGLLIGRGLVHPLDGFSAGKKPSHPELLEDLADEFIRSGYDVRKLVKSIVLSKPYQLSSRRAAAEEAASRLFSQASVAPLLPEQLFDSVVRATGLDEAKPNPKGKNGSPQESFRETFFREFKVSVQPNEPAVPAAEPTISQALFFLNGELVARGTSVAAEFRLARLMEREKDAGRRIEELFLTTLSRPPKARETEALLARIRKAGDSPRIYEDIFWALLNSTEFVTRH
ncbi:MAG: DUF1549 domain-containing protein [Planctomycetes bacterium]|nr:DUF1549 domain-containing protein [Planctomycetota bacterium]